MLGVSAAVAFRMVLALAGFIVVALWVVRRRWPQRCQPRQDRLEPSVGIALGSASQIALFVGPIVVLFSYVIGTVPTDLQF